MRDKVIGLEKPKRVSKSPWEYRVRKKAKKMPKESKWAKDAQKKNGTQEPASNVTKKPK